jgi:hypothetical protein
MHLKRGEQRKIFLSRISTTCCAAPNPWELKEQGGERLSQSFSESLCGYKLSQSEPFWRNLLSNFFGKLGKSFKNSPLLSFVVLMLNTQKIERTFVRFFYKKRRLP